MATFRVPERERERGTGEPRLGAAAFVRDRVQPIATTLEIPRAVTGMWTPMKTQTMVDAIALPIALRTLKDALRRKRVL